MVGRDGKKFSAVAQAASGEFLQEDKIIGAGPKKCFCLHFERLC